ncbi:MAG: DUF2075 domain-containing protein [Chitinophagaceae bacterium]|nr:MAG: DUF2075 domain-containing protein [Chitinophagaceae bacterium]
MPINLIAINGHNPLVNYSEFEHELHRFLGPRCTEATCYLFNNFPAPVSAEATIDLLLLISLREMPGNFTSFIDPKGDRHYFRNLILPVVFTSQYKASNIRVEEDALQIDNFEYNDTEEVNSLKFGLINFLVKHVELEKQKLHLEPLEFILNDKASLCWKNKIVDSRFSAPKLFEWLWQQFDLFSAYKDWREAAGGYERFRQDAAKINEAAARYAQVGYLTRRKIERITRQLTNVSAMYEAVGKQPLLIVGKAGTGKTAHMLHLLMRCLREGHHVTFLTYNHLLTKEIAAQVKLTLNALRDDEEPAQSNSAKASVNTLMSYLFRLSRSLGVLHLMTEPRVKELDDILKKSMRQIVNELPAIVQTHGGKIFGHLVNWNIVIELVQNSKWNVAAKQYGIAFVKYLRQHNRSLTQGLAETARDFYYYKNEQLREMTHNEVFLRDYTGCLKNTLNAMRDTERFYEDFQVQDKYGLLDVLFNLPARKQDEELEQKRISLGVFKKRVKNVMNGRVGKQRVLMIDEGQDCHPYERDIFYELFGPTHVVATFGGQEQLVRFAETCNWGMSNGRELPVRKIPSGNRSFRIKKNVLDFCNFIAERHGISLDLKPHSEEDPGELIFDFRALGRGEPVGSFPALIEKGKVNGCSVCESLLILDVNTFSRREAQPSMAGQPAAAESVSAPANSPARQVRGVVNEFGVLDDQVVGSYQPFAYLNELGEAAEYWVGATANKGELPFPAPNEVRVINYESCRGLEAWSVMCLHLDAFYQAQVNSDDAERYLLHEDLYRTSEQRAARYAITWVLMAATRSIDTLYLQMHDERNEFVKLCREYAARPGAECRTIV